MGKRKRTYEEWIGLFKATHGAKYDYSKSVFTFKPGYLKIEIICPVHGSFWQSPYGHVKGYGCKECSNKIARPNRKTKEDWLREFKIAHGDKYNYSKSVFLGCDDKIEIICPIHGSFYQRTIEHSRGKGCAKCGFDKAAKDRRKDPKTWVEEFRSIHGDKYNYSKSIFEHSHKKIEIICPIHGSFWQYPTNHKKGHGCEKCGHDTRGLSTRKTKEGWLEDFKSIHGDRYDYSKSEFKTAVDKIEVICKKHGPFSQRPQNHRLGEGCPECAKKSPARYKKKK